MKTAACTPLPSLCDGDMCCISREDIIHAAKKAPILHQQGGVTVRQVQQNLVLKYGPEVHLSEAWNMQVVLEKTNVRLPAVIDAWEGKDDNQGLGYLLMEYIEGDAMAEIWPHLDTHSRHDVYSQLDESLCQLHAIQLSVPGPVGGAVSRGPLVTDSGAGPFISKMDLESWFNERLLVCQEFHRAPPTQPSFSGQFENLVMCHMDIAVRNMILDRQRRVWILDWAHAGGYPVYFNEAVMRRTGDPDFTEGLLRMIGEEHSENVERLLTVGFALTTAADTRPAGHSKLSVVDQYLRETC